MEGGADADIVQVNGSTTAERRVHGRARTAPGRLRPHAVPARSASTSAPSETLIVNGIGGNDTFTVGNLTGVATLTTLNLNGFDGDDTFIVGLPTFSRAVAFTRQWRPRHRHARLRGASRRPSPRTSDSARTGLAATLGADQENPPTTHRGTGTATVTNYNVVTHTFDISVTVADLPPADVTGFHIHQGRGRRERPDHRRFHRVAPLVPVGTGFTFTRDRPDAAAPPARRRSWAAAPTSTSIRRRFPGGAIRGQLFSGGNANVLTSGTATGAARSRQH